MTTSEGAGAQTITEHELAQCERANQTGRPPVVFVHGLWLLPISWNRWAALFEEYGYVALMPGWPDDPTPSRRRRRIPRRSPTNRSARWPTTSRPSSGGRTRSLPSSATPSAGC
jgi:hypothetical protein